jgi:hypothetical protein
MSSEHDYSTAEAFKNTSVYSPNAGRLLYDPKDTPSQRAGSGYDRRRKDSRILPLLLLGIMTGGIYGLYKTHMLFPLMGAIVGGLYMDENGAFIGAVLGGLFALAVKR